MKQLLTLLLILSSFLSACEKEYTKDTGVITSPDSGYCGCCGGWFIEIDAKTYRFRELPENSNLDLENETLPLHVKLHWKKDDGSCQNIILISKIKELD
ncbi:MAG: hypothetical protein ACPGVB_09930 [Chitinophagales bacterium]